MDDHTRALIKNARTGTREDYMALLAALIADEEQAEQAARQARKDVETVVAIAMLERPEVNRTRMSELTGIRYRNLFKVRDRGYPDELKSAS